MLDKAIMSHWGWENIGRGLDATSAAEMHTSFWRSDILVELYRDTVYAAAGVILILAVFAQGFRKFNIGNFRQLSDSARLTLLTHILFFLVFLGTLIPFTATMIKLFFGPLGPEYLLQKSDYRTCAFSLGFQIVLYAYEGGCRAIIRINGFLVLHHVMFCTLTVLAFQPESLFMLKICIIGSCFATYEVLLYAALISRKISAFSKLFPGLIISGVALYASTRMLQTAMFISLFVYGFEPMRHNPQDIALYWVGLLMCLALTALQMYTFVIYRGIWKSTMTKATIHSDAHAVPGVQAKDSPFQAKQGMTAQMIRLDTASSELDSQLPDNRAPVPSMELRRGSLMHSSHSGIFNSQSLLLDDIEEELRMPRVSGIFKKLSEKV